VNQTRVRVGVREGSSFVQDRRPYFCYSPNTMTDRVLCALIADHTIHIEILAKLEGIFACSLKDLLLDISTPFVAHAPSTSPSISRPAASHHLEPHPVHVHESDGSTSKKICAVLWPTKSESDTHLAQ
jgi:hypothetical protein